jgi:hypothetical protein
MECPAFLIRGRHGCALLDQEACYFEVPKIRCQGQGSLLLVVPAVNICATIDQQLRDVEVPFRGREMQRSPAIFFLCIHIGAAVYQEPRSRGQVSCAYIVTRGQGMQSRGVQLCVSRAFTSEPQSSNSRATSTCPHRDAACNGMKPSSSRELMSEPRSIRKCAMSSFPLKQESQRCLLLPYSEHRDLHLIQVAVPQSHDTHLRCRV